MTQIIYTYVGGPMEGEEFRCSYPFSAHEVRLETDRLNGKIWETARYIPFPEPPRDGRALLVFQRLEAVIAPESTTTHP